MSEPLFVDPERLAQHARPYEAASQEWFGVQETVADIRARYNGAWGDDDLGNKFGPSFLEGMDTVALRAKGVGDNLLYYGEGLVENGRIYGDARDDADQTTRSLLLDSEYVGAYKAPDGAVYFGVNTVDDGQGQPPPYLGVVGSEEAEAPLEPMMAARMMAQSERVPGQPVLSERLTPVTSVRPLQPLQPVQLIQPVLPLEPTQLFLPVESVDPGEPPIEQE